MLPCSAEDEEGNQVPAYEPPDVPPRRPTLVLLDCDGVLVDTERRLVPVDVTVLAALGWQLDEAEVVDRFLGRPHEHMVAEVERHVGRSLPEGWERQFQPLYDAALADLAPVDGVVEALDRLTVPTCVASSGSHAKMRRTLGRTGLLPRFSGRIFSADDVARGKPAPDLFLHAARSLGHEPAGCVVVEDSVAGVLAGRAAGMRVLGYGGGLVPGARLASAGAEVFRDMRALPDLLG
jgi:HAD superfamily hydrolase (TIGR01509 family)